MIHDRGALHSTLSARSAVFLCQSQGHAAEEFVHGDVHLGGKLFGEHDGEHHEDAVGQELWVAQ